MARPPADHRPPRVTWTDYEKTKIIDRAAETLSSRPDLAGLPLLRAAMTVLPVTRRRKLIAVTQAPWFEPGLAKEIKMRRTSSDTEFKMSALQFHQSAVAMLALIHRDLADIKAAMLRSPKGNKRAAPSRSESCRKHEV